jgi:hypothetical protein
MAVLAATLLLGCGADPQPSREGPEHENTRTNAQGLEAASCPGFRQVNVPGFGNPDNLYSWSMQVFGDHLYVGTLNNVTGPEVWRYDGTAWEKVLERPVSTGNTGFRSMTVFGDMLYVSSVNDTQGAELWRTSDGVNWQAMITGGNGNPLNTSFRGLTAFRNWLYMGMQNQSGTGGQLWRSRDGVTWGAISQNGLGDVSNHSLHALAVFQQTLYVGTANDTLTQIFRSGDGTTFTRVVGPGAATPAGFGLPGTTNSVQLFPYNKRLSIHRTVDGVTYQTVTKEGGGNPNNNFAWRFASYEGYLWLGTGNFNPILGEGGSVLRSQDGLRNWQTLVGEGGTYYDYGFDKPLNWGVRTFAEYQGKLHIGTVQCWKEACDPYTQGTEVWEWSGESCAETGGAL